MCVGTGSAVTSIADVTSTVKVCNCFPIDRLFMSFPENGSDEPTLTRTRKPFCLAMMRTKYFVLAYQLEGGQFVFDFTL